MDRLFRPGPEVDAVKLAPAVGRQGGEHVPAGRAVQDPGLHHDSGPGRADEDEKVQGLAGKTVAGSHAGPATPPPEPAGALLVPAREGGPMILGQQCRPIDAPEPRDQAQQAGALPLRIGPGKSGLEDET